MIVYLAKEPCTEFVHNDLQNLVYRLLPKAWSRETMDAIDICNIIIHICLNGVSCVTEIVINLSNKPGYRPITTESILLS